MHTVHVGWPVVFSTGAVSGGQYFLQECVTVLLTPPQMTDNFLAWPHPVPHGEKGTRTWP